MALVTPAYTPTFRAMSLLLAGALIALESQDIDGTSYFAAHSTLQEYLPWLIVLHMQTYFQPRVQAEKSEPPMPFHALGQSARKSLLLNRTAGIIGASALQHVLFHIPMHSGTRWSHDDLVWCMGGTCGRLIHVCGLCTGGPTMT